MLAVLSLLEVSSPKAHFLTPFSGGGGPSRAYTPILYDLVRILQDSCTKLYNLKRVSQDSYKILQDRR